MRRREVVKAQQGGSVLFQTMRRPVIFVTVFVQEQIQGSARIRFGFGHPDVMQVGLDFLLHGFGHTVQDIGRLVHPATLGFDVAIHIFHGGKKAQSTISNGQFRGYAQTSAFQLQQQCLPALRYAKQN